MSEERATHKARGTFDGGGELFHEVAAGPKSNNCCREGGHGRFPEGSPARRELPCFHFYRASGNDAIRIPFGLFG
jgi:hypothetical protein